VWSIIEGTPAGVTLHYVDAGIDTGDIIARHEVAVDAVDTGETLYRKLERAAVTLFRENWPAIRAGRIERTAQNDEGASHRTRDVETIDRIDLDRTYTGRELINLLRARTFPPHRGAYIEVDGQRVYLELSLSCDTKVGHG
jgi:methionyl-tRNA formyltransferase